MQVLEEQEPPDVVVSLSNFPSTSDHDARQQRQQTRSCNQPVVFCNEDQDMSDSESEAETDVIVSTEPPNRAVDVRSEFSNGLCIVFE